MSRNLLRPHAPKHVHPPSHKWYGRVHCSGLYITIGWAAPNNWLVHFHRLDIKPPILKKDFRTHLGKITVCGFCPFALMPLPLPLFLSWFSCSFKFWRLSREVIFCICFHISVFVQISSTLLMLLLPAQMTAMTFFSWRQTTSLPFLAANVEALSKHLKAWRWARRRCRSSRDLRIWIANAKYCLFWFDI